MKYYYVAVTVKQDRRETVFAKRFNPDPDPGLFSYVVCLSEQDNILSKLSAIGGLISANVCSTKKLAESLTDLWNETYKANGEHLFYA